MWPNGKASAKPDGLYRAQCFETSCECCAYMGESGYCSIHKEKILNRWKMKCKDFMSEEAAIEPSNE